MKALFRLLALLILVTVIVAPLTAQTTTYVSPRFNSVNVRTGPSIAHGIIAELYRGGSQYPVLNRSLTGNWLLIDIGYAQGWVHQAYVIQSNFGSYVAPTTTAMNYGQGGGYVAPTTTTNYGQGGGFAAPTTTTNYGQGGGFAAPTTSVQATDFINSTVASWVGLNIRSGPGLEYRLIAIMPQGDRATPLGRNARGTWYFIDYNGIQGWVTHTLVAFPPAIDATELPVVSNG